MWLTAIRGATHGWLWHRWGWEGLIRLGNTAPALLAHAPFWSIGRLRVHLSSRTSTYVLSRLCEPALPNSGGVRSCGNIACLDREFLIWRGKRIWRKLKEKSRRDEKKRFSLCGLKKKKNQLCPSLFYQGVISEVSKSKGLISCICPSKS